MKNSGFDEKQGLTFENCCNQVPQGVEDSVATSVLLIRTWRHGDSSTSTSPYAVGRTIDIHRSLDNTVFSSSQPWNQVADLTRQLRAHTTQAGDLWTLGQPVEPSCWLLQSGDGFYLNRYQGAMTAMTHKKLSLQKPVQTHLERFPTKLVWPGSALRTSSPMRFDQLGMTTYDYMTCPEIPEITCPVQCGLVGLCCSML